MDLKRAGGSACQMNDAQLEEINAWVTAPLPRSTRQIGVFIEKKFPLGTDYAAASSGTRISQARLGSKQAQRREAKELHRGYHSLSNSLADNEAVLFADAVHPT